MKEVKEFAKTLLDNIKNKKIYLISHHDTDGISSAAIFSKTLERLNNQFSVKIVKQLDENTINNIPEKELIIILDLGSSHLEELSKKENKIFIIDHHEIKKNITSDNLKILNPHLFKKYLNLCSAELSYLVSKELSNENKDLSYLSIIGMIGDTVEKDINEIRNKIIKESNVKIKKGLLIYPSTRPIDKALEFSSRPFIPGVTGNPQGTYELLEEAGIKKTNKKYKPLLDLDEDEMKNLTTAVLLRTKSKKPVDYIGNLYLIKLFNKIEDAREISAMINACSRMGHPEIALMFCMGNQKARKKAERIYVKYRQHIISGLRYIDKTQKILGKEYVIINAKENIKDTLIGTMASILSFSQVYQEGTIIIAMAYDEDKIKVSARIAGRNNKSNKNLKKLIDSVTTTIGGQAGGHQMAAGCTINKEHEEKFIELIRKKLDLEIRI